MGVKKLDNSSVSIELAIQKLQSVREEIKELKKSESFFADIIKSAGNGSYHSGDLMAVVEDASRSSIDTKALEAKLGADFMKSFKKNTDYVKLSIKKN